MCICFNICVLQEKSTHSPNYFLTERLTIKSDSDVIGFLLMYKKIYCTSLAGLDT